MRQHLQRLHLVNGSVDLRPIESLERNLFDNELIGSRHRVVRVGFALHEIGDAEDPAAGHTMVRESRTLGRGQP